MRIIAGTAHGRRITAPRGMGTRPATARVRASIFSRLATRCDLAEARVLDLYAGSGSLGLEAFSRGAAHVTFVDSSRAAAAAIGRNLAAFGLTTRARVLVLDVMRAIVELGAAGGFDLVFVDAPYAHDNSAEVLAALARADLVEVEGLVVARQAGRAPRPAAAAFACINEATFGDHRVALYRRLAQAAEV